MAAAPSFVDAAKTGLVQAVNADGTNAKTIVTAGSNGSKVVSLIATSDDSSARAFKISIVRSGTAYVIGTVSIPANSGTNGSTATVNLLGSGLLPGLAIDNDGQSYLLLESGDTLTATLTTSAVTAAKVVSFIATYGNF